jgi:hypothetical protein
MIIRLADCPAQPWKNGLGRTREIAVQPSATGSADFLWRVSVAEVDSAAPFSRFPGIDRHIVLLAGAGFTMTLDGSHTHALTTPLAPFAFAGEAQVEVTLIAGATRDFNLMTRRSFGRGEVQVLAGPATHTPDPATILVFCVSGGIDTLDGRLGAGDTWRPSQPASDSLVLREGAVALLVRIQPRAS